MVAEKLIYPELTLKAVERVKTQISNISYFNPNNISDEYMELIADKAMEFIDVNHDGFLQLLIRVSDNEITPVDEVNEYDSNCFYLEMHLKYDGFSYRRIQKTYTDTFMYKHGESVQLHELGVSLGNIIYDKIADLNILAKNYYYEYCDNY